MTKAHGEWLKWLGTLNPEKEIKEVYAGSLCAALREPNRTSGQNVQTVRAPHSKALLIRRTKLTTEQNLQKMHP